MNLYILQTCDGRCLSKDLDWTAEMTSDNLFKVEHQDVALNQLIELNAKDIDLRAKIVRCKFDPAGQLIEPDQCSAAA